MTDGTNWFHVWVDAVGQADRRAWLTGLRYRVRFDRANDWWTISETVCPVRRRA